MESKRTLIEQTVLIWDYTTLIWSAGWLGKAWLISLIILAVLGMFD
jgi:UPF0716 family protein affecting phage T7 exclusion